MEQKTHTYSIFILYFYWTLKYLSSTSSVLVLFFFYLSVTSCLSVILFLLSFYLTLKYSTYLNLSLVSLTLSLSEIPSSLSPIFHSFLGVSLSSTHLYLLTHPPFYLVIPFPCSYWISHTHLVLACWIFPPKVQDSIFLQWVVAATFYSTAEAWWCMLVRNPHSRD